MPSDVDPAASSSPQPPPGSECDLVMKGGITSGIIYPPLVLKLKDAYRFRGVGGTSAGALAAAAAAAAEHGRDSGGFAKLAEINERLAGGGFLEGLFQPAAATRPLFDTAVAVVARRAEQKASEKTSRVKEPPKTPLQQGLDALSALAQILPKTNPDRYRAGSRAGVLFSIGIAAVMALFASAVFYVAAGLTLGFSVALRPALIALAALAILPAIGLALLGAPLGGLIGSLYDLYRILTERVPENRFGICDGRTTQGHSALTEWLDECFNHLAGLRKGGRPLTFGDLWGTRDPSAEKAVDLRMVTSNISQEQPYIVPFKRDLFIFKKSDIDALFPKNVAEHMVKKSRRLRGFRLPPGYYFLPCAADLPVVVGARMSMSFPVLISMIPLYTLSHQALPEPARFNTIELDGPSGRDEAIALLRRDEAGAWVEATGDGPIIAEEHLQLNWFSDGGVCSNFPIHFFDAWLPTRPTFGVNLTTQLADANIDDIEAVGACVRGRSSYVIQQTPDAVAHRSAQLETEDERYARDIYLPRPDGDPSPAWRPLPTLGSFLVATLNTAYDFRDNMQAMLPSYRERIVQVRLTDDQGGINLGMPPEVLRGLVSKGEAAGETLRTEFNFQQHQWVRFRVFMAQLENGLASLRSALLAAPTGGGVYRSLLDLQGNGDFPYRRDQAWTLVAVRRLDEMSKLLHAWSDPADLFYTDPRPLPEPVLRVTPEL